MEAGQGLEEIFSLNDFEKKEALIKLVRKGAPSVAAKEPAAGEASERVRYSIRMTRPVLERINRAAADRDLPTPTNTWITEAMLAQLKKEGF
jgi:hypothetical protein